MKEDNKSTLPVIERCACGCQGILRKAKEGWSVRCVMLGRITDSAWYSTARRAIEAWNRTQQSMDQLTRDVIAALRAGMSYGNYKATQGERPPAVRYPKKEVSPGPEVPELRCVQCGGLIPPGCRSKKYCGPVCAENARMQQKAIRQQRESAQKKREKVEKIRLCAICRKPIPAGSGRKLYCSAECADRARNLQIQEANRKRGLRRQAARALSAGGEE